MNRLSSSLVAVLASALAIVACASPIEQGDGDGETAESAESAATVDVSADVFGRYASRADAVGGEFTALVLRSNKTYALTKVGGGTESGTFTATKPASGMQIRLSPTSTTSKRIYRASLAGSVFRPTLTLTRSGKTSVLDRLEPTSCASVNCNAGYACAVEDDADGVPRAVCNPDAPVDPPAPTTPAWKSAAPGTFWGLGFTQAVTAVASGMQINGKPLWCTIRPATSVISCAVTGWDFSDVAASIADDGTFDVGGASGSSAKLKGKVHADGRVILEAFSVLKCVNANYCERFYGEGLPKQSSDPAVELCRVPGQTFPSGGWTAGYYQDCTKCDGRCEGGR